jgi:hypothetical protein
MIETQMAVKAKQVSELETQAEYLQRTAPEKMDEIQMKKSQVERRFEQLKAPLLDRQRQLEKKKEAFQVRLHLFVMVVLQCCFVFEKLVGSFLSILHVYYVILN